MESSQKCIELNAFQREVLVGVILGDAHLECRSASVRIKFEQSLKHREYLMHLYDVFRDLVGMKPKRKMSRRLGKYSEKWCFQSRIVPELSYYYDLFYRDKKKVLDLRMLDTLTPIGLAYWFMDDGSIKSRQSKGVILNTQGFRLNEVECLCQVLVVKFKLIVKVRPQKVGYQMYISGRSYELFLELVEKHIIRSMRYKLTPARKDASRKTICPKSTGGAQW